MALINLFDPNQDSSLIVGHAVLFSSTLLCFLYLIVFEWYILGKFQNNFLCQLLVFQLLGQMGTCIAINSGLNDGSYYEFNFADVMNRLSGAVSLFSLNVCLIILVSHINYRNYFKIKCLILGILSTLVFILAIIKQGTFGKIIMPIAFLLTTIFGIIAFIRIKIAHNKNIISINPNIISREGMEKILTITLIGLIAGSLCTILSFKIPLLLAGWGIILYPSLTIEMIYVGQMDFMSDKNEKYDVNDEFDENKEDERENLLTSEQNMSVHVSSNHSNVNVPTVTFSDRCRMLVQPIRSKKDVTVNDDTETHYIISPEVFRIWFYIGFFIYVIIAIIVATVANSVNINDNPVISRFGSNNICIYFDEQPFSDMGAALWFPLVVTMLLYEYFDNFRIYDEYRDSNSDNSKAITKTFYIFYTISSIIESFCVIWFLQITATTPYENIYIHTIPYICLNYCLWLIAFKHFLYFNKIGIFDKYHSCYYYTGIIYLILLIMSVLLKTWITMSNLFEMYLWKRPGLEWTAPIGSANDKLYMFLVLICPIIIYFIFTKELKCVKVIINRVKQ